MLFLKIIGFIMAYGFLVGVCKYTLIHLFDWEPTGGSDFPTVEMWSLCWPITLFMYLVIFLPAKLGNRCLEKLFTKTEKPTTF